MQMLKCMIKIRHCSKPWAPLHLPVLFYTSCKKDKYVVSRITLTAASIPVEHIDRIIDLDKLHGLIDETLGLCMPSEHPMEMFEDQELVYAIVLHVSILLYNGTTTSFQQ